LRYKIRFEGARLQYVCAFHGLGPLALNVRFLGQGIGPSQGMYLRRMA